MGWKSGFGLIAIGVVAGYFLARLSIPDGTQATQSAGLATEAPALQGSILDHEAADLRKQVAALTAELETVRTKSSTVSVPRRMTLEEFRKQREEGSKSVYARVVQQENDRLLAAGFSMERIEWLRGRADELEKARRQAETERRQKGLLVQIDLAYTYDRDLDLVKEIGEEEYDRYRHALGRPKGISITSVSPGGIGESVGLKSGDEIIRYNGQRVYNRGQVGNLSQKDAKPGERLAVEVLRDGRSIVVSVPAGDLGFSSPMPIPELSRLMQPGSSSSRP